MMWYYYLHAVVTELKGLIWDQQRSLTTTIKEMIAVQEGLTTLAGYVQTAMKSIQGMQELDSVRHEVIITYDRRITELERQVEAMLLADVFSELEEGE